MKRIMFEIYRVNMKGKRMGYSSESNAIYLKNKGVEPEKWYKIDDAHEFRALPRKGDVIIQLKYKGNYIDTDSYMYRNRKEWK